MSFDLCFNKELGLRVQSQPALMSGQAVDHYSSLVPFRQLSHKRPNLVGQAGGTCTPARASTLH